MRKMKRSVAILLCLVFLFSLVPVTAAETEEDIRTYTLASGITAGKQYVIVSNGYALTNRVSGNSLAGTPVTLDGDDLASPVTEDMIWTVQKGTSADCGDYTTGYFLTNGDSGYLARSSSSNNEAPLNTTTYDASNVSTKPSYCYWVLKDDLHNVRKALFLCNYSSNTAYTFIMRGGASFTTVGCSHSSEGDICQQNLLRLFEVDYGPDCDHSFTTEVIAPTCTEKGYTLHTCAKCGYSYKNTYVHPLGHDWSEGKVSGDVTFSECKRCGAKRYEPLKPRKNQILFLSDLHSGYDNVNGYHNLRAMLPQLKEENFYPQVISCGGDYVEALLSENNDWQKSYDALIDILDATYPEAAHAFTTGNHEWEWNQMSDAKFEELFGFPRVGLNYSNDEYEIFQIGAQGNTSNVDKEMYWDEDIEKLDHYLASRVGSNKIIFIQTHWPLHWADNWGSRTIKNAEKVIDTINNYGDDLNIFFIWGHNHYTDEMRHKILEYGDTINFTQSSGKKIKFTYANAGCMNNYHDYWQGDTTEHHGPGVCLSAELTDKDIIFTYSRIENAYYIPGTGTMTHDADLVKDDGTILKHPAEVTVALREPVCEHDFDISVTEPTCIEQGYTTKVCKLCGKSLTCDYTDPLGHVWDDIEVTKMPTDTEKGELVYTCTRCGETKIKRLPRANAIAPDDIDFTDPASESGFEIIGKSSAAISDGVGLKLVTTKDGFEPANDQLSGTAATTPKDAIMVPVESDWTATLTFDADLSGSANGYYQFFGFYAAEGDDYQNMAGIRGGDGALQNFLRVGGTITADTEALNSTPGIASNGTYYFRLEKDGDTYICSRSDDGEDFTEIFSYESTGIEADRILIDAYTGLTEGYAFTLKSLTFEGNGASAHVYKKTVTAPTCTEDGYTVYSCVLCDDSYTGDVIPALGHEFKDGVCIRCGISEKKPCPSLEFKDVPAKGNWAHEGIDYCVSEGYMKGTGVNAFNPSGNVTRAQLVTILYRVAGNPEVEFKGTFTDVAAGQWYSEAIEWAAKNSIVNGTAPGKFNPMGQITREQIAAILYRYSGTPAVEGNLSAFPDNKNVSSYAVDALLWATKEGLINGIKSGNVTNLAPKANATRAQIASIIMRFIGGSFSCD